MITATDNGRASINGPTYRYVPGMSMLGVTTYAIITSTGYNKPNTSTGPGLLTRQHTTATSNHTASQRAATAIGRTSVTRNVSAPSSARRTAREAFSHSSIENTLRGKTRLSKRKMSTPAATRTAFTI